MLTIPPVLEPFTLEQAKLRAGLDWDPGDARDDLMTSFIKAARSQVEQDTGIACFTQTHTVSLARAAGSCWPVRLPWRPVQSVTVDTLDAGLYVLDPSGVDPTPATLTLATGATWGPTLTATIVVGFLTVADFQAQAPGLMHAIGLLLAHYATVGRDLTTVGTSIARTPAGYDEAIAPYQLVVVP